VTSLASITLVLRHRGRDIYDNRATIVCVIRWSRMRLSRLGLVLALLAPSAIARASKPTLRLERIDPAAFADSGKVRVFASIVELEGQVDEGRAGFQLVVDGKRKLAPESVESFRGAQVPLDLVLVIESSALYGVQKLPPPSAIAPAPQKKGKAVRVAPAPLPSVTPTSSDLPLDRVKEAMSQLLESRDNKTRVLVVEYGGEVTPHPPFLAARAAGGALDDLQPDDESGDLHLVDAVRTALVELSKSHDDTTPPRRLIVVVSDGLNAQMDRGTFRALGDAAAKARVPVHTIAFSPADDRGPLVNLGEVSKRSNGTFRWAKNADELKAQIDTLADELDKQYVLTFALPLDSLDGHRFQLREDRLVSNELRWEPGGAVFGYTGPTTRRSLAWLVLEWAIGILGALFALYVGFAIVLRLATRKKSGATLVFIEGPQRGRVVQLARAPIVLGKGGPIVIDDAAASTRHCQLGFDGRGWLVTDLGSTNGTWLDGVRMTAPRYLQSGQVLQLGQTRLRFMVIS
jgi:hypothetical protein